MVLGPTAASSRVMPAPDPHTHPPVSEFDCQAQQARSEGGGDNLAATRGSARPGRRAETQKAPGVYGGVGSRRSRDNCCAQFTNHPSLVL